MAFECQHCLKTFIRESSFMKHECGEMKKAKEIGSSVGLGAYELYCEWMKQKGRKAPSIETFSTSRYYKSFVSFYKHIKKLSIPTPALFIKVMIQNGDLSPMLWCRDEFYSMYLEWLDRKQDPIDQAALTVETLMKISEAGEKPISEVFTLLSTGHVMQLIRQRQLSPWILLCSVKFKEFLGSISTAEKTELLNLLGYSYWIDKFMNNEKTVANMKLITKELGI